MKILLLMKSREISYSSAQSGVEMSIGGVFGEVVMLLVRNLTRYFRGLLAVNDLSLEVKKGDIVGLVGPNGAGKTTVFNLITGFYQPTKGEVIFDGQDITGKKPSLIAALGLVRTFQSNLLFNEQTCFENVMIAHYLERKSIFSNMLFSTQAGRNEGEKIRHHTGEILERTGLFKAKDQRAGSLPQGLKRVLGVAVALATNPKLLLLDEPITGMTYAESEAMLKLVQQLNSQGLTVLLVEHNMRAVMDICDRVIVLNFGKKLVEGLPDEVKNNKDVIEAYLGG